MSALGSSSADNPYASSLPSDPSSSSSPLLGASAPTPARSRLPTTSRSRRTLGLLLLSLVVLLWVSSNFLTHAIFADNTYQKPFFITYLNTSVFTLYLLPSLFSSAPAEPKDASKLTRRQTMRLSAEFCVLWFAANYLNSYCLAFTSVASATILSSTSAMFTLLLGSALGVERMSVLKVGSVLLSLLGIVLISNVDVRAGASSTSPDKTHGEVLTGDAMAIASALAYATYITLLKFRVREESRVDMRLFFGYVGLFNVVFLWPGLWILSAAGVEKWGLPTDGRVWAVVGVNAGITLVSDFCWAYAMLLTTPLVVTVGLSATIPLAMLGEMGLVGRVAGVWYWVGAACVGGGFWLLSRDGEPEGEGVERDPERGD